MVLILFIILYFSIVGGLFYKLYISTPIEQRLVNGPGVEPVLELEKEFAHEPVRSKYISNEAADINVG
ncbi:MAG: hypothetical protein ABS935_11215 [Solibacillus sp.]